MSRPVLVVHGVANHDRTAFQRRVSMLQDIVGTQWTLVPVFWGDLGANAEHIRDTIPHVPLVRLALTRGAAGEEIVIAAARATLASRSDISAAAVRGDDDALSVAIRDELPRTAYLQHANVEALRSAGEIIGSSVSDSVSDATLQTRLDLREIGTDVAARAREIIRQLDRFSGALLGGSIGSGVEFLRETYGAPIVDFLGDILVYQRARETIHRRLFDALRRWPGYGTQERPVDVVAHSLGGVITVDAATRAQNPLWIDGLITFGSQPAFFQAIDPRSPPLTPYAPSRPVKLPATIKRWTNLWEPLDPFAFITAKVFELASGGPPIDIEVAHLASYGFNTHGSYWESPELKTAFTKTFT